MTLNLKNSCPDRTKHALSKKCSFLIFNKFVRNVTLKAMSQLVDKKRLIALVLMAFVTIVTLSLRQWNDISTTLSMSRSLPFINCQWNYERDRKSERDQMRKEHIQQKGYKVTEIWDCKWWELYRTDATVKNHLRADFPYRQPLSEERFTQEIKDGILFSYVQSDLKVPQHLKAYYANFPPIFKKTVVSRNDIGDLMKEYAEKEGIMPQPRRKLISSFQLTNGTIITPLLLFYLHLGLECKKNHRFVQYTPKKYFNSFVQSAVKARRQGEENPNGLKQRIF